MVVIAPNQLKNLRSRSGSARNKDDGFDAYVLADTRLSTACNPLLTASSTRERIEHTFESREG